jgi:hypothetical protein
MVPQRLQVRVSDQQKQLVDRLQELCGLKTQTAVIENALMLLAWAAAQSHRGLAIASVDEQKQRYNEVHLPALEGARLAGQLKGGKSSTESSRTPTAQLKKAGKIEKSLAPAEQRKTEKVRDEKSGKLVLTTTLD